MHLNMILGNSSGLSIRPSGIGCPRSRTKDYEGRQGLMLVLFGAQPPSPKLLRRIARILGRAQQFEGFWAKAVVWSSEDSSTRLVSTLIVVDIEFVLWFGSIAACLGTWTFWQGIGLGAFTCRHMPFPFWWGS